jgi:hypothetical protein
LAKIGPQSNGIKLNTSSTNYYPVTQRQPKHTGDNPQNTGSAIASHAGLRRCQSLSI